MFTGQKDERIVGAFVESVSIGKWSVTSVDCEKFLLKQKKEE